MASGIEQRLAAIEAGLLKVAELQQSHAQLAETARYYVLHYPSIIFRTTCLTPEIRCKVLSQN
jgi:hypothetical protein